MEVTQSYGIDVPRVQIRNDCGASAHTKSHPCDADQYGPSFAGRRHAPEGSTGQSQGQEEERSPDRKVDQRDIDQYVAPDGGSVDIGTAHPMEVADPGVQPLQSLEVETPGRGETKMDLYRVAEAGGVLARDADVVGEVPAIVRDCHVERCAAWVADQLATRSQACRVEAAREQERALERSHETTTTHGPSVPAERPSRNARGLQFSRNSMTKR